MCVKSLGGKNLKCLVGMREVSELLAVKQVQRDEPAPEVLCYVLVLAKLFQIVFLYCIPCSFSDRTVS